MHNRLRRLAIVTAAGMFLVLIAGALVTKTDSGRGCGDDWPLCNGKFVPAYTIESLIEYSHRFVTGIEGILVLATAIGVWKSYRGRRDAKAYAAGALFFTVLQALLGAAAVKWPQSDAALSLHFGFSLLAVTNCFLLVFALRPRRAAAETAAAAEPAAGRSSGLPPRSGRDKPSSLAERTGFRRFVWTTMIYCYGVVYLGAYVRHTSSAGGCAGWPLCNGEVLPALTGATGIAFVHRLAALLLFVLVAAIYWISRGGPDRRTPVRFAARWTFGLMGAQILSGGFVVLSFGSDWHLAASLLHTSFITGSFAMLFYLCTLTIPQRNRTVPNAQL